MTTLKELTDQIAALQAQVAEVRQREVGDAIAKARAIVDEYQLTSEDIFGRGKSKLAGQKTGKVAAKYRDPATGKEWTGRGMTPKWMAGKDKAEYLIK